MGMPKKDDHDGELLSKIPDVYREGMQDLSVEGRNERRLNRYRHMGQYIVEIEQDGKAGARYGSRLMGRLSEDLTDAMGGEFSRSHVAYRMPFLNEYRIVHTCGQLSWSHYKTLFGVKDQEERTRLEARG